MTTDIQKIWHYNQPGTRISHEMKMFLAMVARGRIDGASLFGSYGKYTAGGAVSNRGIWPGPTQFQPYNLSGVTDGYVISDSINDVLAGSGIQSVEIHYIDANGDQQAVTRDMDGTNPVLIPTFRFIQCLHTIKGQFAAGNISIIGNAGATTYSYIPLGATRCASSFRMIPTGYTAYLVDFLGGATSGTAAAKAELEVISTEIDSTPLISEGVYLPHNSTLVQDVSLAFAANTVMPVSSGQIVGMWGSTDKGANLAAGYTGWIERTADALEIY